MKLKLAHFSYIWTKSDLGINRNWYPLTFSACLDFPSVKHCCRNAMTAAAKIYRRRHSLREWSLCNMSWNFRGRYDFSSWQVMDMHLTRLFSLVIRKAFAVSGLFEENLCSLHTPSFWILHSSAGQCCWWLKHNYVLFRLGNSQKMCNKNMLP